MPANMTEGKKGTGLDMGLEITTLKEGEEMGDEKMVKVLST